MPWLSLYYPEPCLEYQGKKTPTAAEDHSISKQKPSLLLHHRHIKKLTRMRRIYSEWKWMFSLTHSPSFIRTTKEHHFMLKNISSLWNVKVAVPQCFQLWKTCWGNRRWGRNGCLFCDEILSSIYSDRTRLFIPKKWTREQSTRGNPAKGRDVNQSGRGR